MADDLPIIFQEQTKRIEALERLVAIRELLIPPDGKLVFDLKASDPPVEDGRVYYNTTTDRLRKCENGVWTDIGAGAGVGDVVGPAGATADNIAVFNGITGKIIKDSGSKVSDLVLKNAPITGATKTKITYDTKGLVTAGADATTADINDSTNRRYVTDANLVVINNTSGTNTGDQDLSGYVPTSRTINGAALSANITLLLASAHFLNQGTTTTVLHGNAAGNPAWGAVVENDITLVDVTTNDFTTAKHGFVPKGTNLGKFLKDDGTWATVVGGGGGMGGMVENEVPGGAVNGSNTAFTTAGAFITGSLQVYHNGVRLKGGGEDYTEGSSAFTMVVAPLTGDILIVGYNTSLGTGTGGSSSVLNEVPGGAVNGINTVFTTASTFLTGTLRVHLNGQRLKPVGVDFTEGVGGFTMIIAPPSGDILLVDYEIAFGTNSLIVNETPAGLVNGSNTLFTLSLQYVAGSTQVYRDGQLMKPGGNDYTETSPTAGTITFVVAPVTGSVILVTYQNTVSATGNADTVDGYHANATPTANQIAVLDGSANVPANTVATGSIETAAVTGIKMGIVIGCELEHSGPVSMANGVFTTLAFDSEVWDTNSMHSNVTNNSRITIVTSGVYMFMAQGLWAGAAGGTQRRVDFYFNGGNQSRGYTVNPVGGNNITWSISLIWFIPAGDYVEIKGYQDSGAAINCTAHFQCYRLGHYT